MTFIAHASTIRAALIRVDRPRNEWFVLEPYAGVKFGAHISNDGSARELTFVTRKYSNGYFVLIGVYASDTQLLVAEFQIDNTDVVLLTDCFLSCDDVLPLDIELFCRLRVGAALRYGGIIKSPPERDFRTVSLKGIDKVLDELEQ